MKIGLKGNFETMVNTAMLADAVGSGLVSVFATPMMIAFMEKTAAESVLPCLIDDQTTVGMYLDVHHIAATPKGMNVRFESVLTNIEGKILTFEVTAFDEKEKIGYGTHKRAIVNRTRFEEKVNAKNDKGCC